MVTNAAKIIFRQAQDDFCGYELNSIQTAWFDYTTPPLTPLPLPPAPQQPLEEAGGAAHPGGHLRFARQRQQAVQDAFFPGPLSRPSPFNGSPSQTSTFCLVSCATL